MAIGGAIGTGLFLGSGIGIHKAGPSILLVYVVVGMMLFVMMRAMGELLLSNLGYRTFQDFAADYLGEWARFFVGWTYWLCLISIATADVGRHPDLREILVAGPARLGADGDRRGRSCSP